MTCFKNNLAKKGPRELEFGFCYNIFGNNSIRTSKYTALNFLPMNFIEQFSKAPNVYFLILILLQFIKAISITDGIPTILPTLLIIIAISAFKDFLEDYKRWKSDSQENNRKIDRVLFKAFGIYFNYQTLCKAMIGTTIV